MEKRGAGDDNDEMTEADQQRRLLAGDELQQQRGEADRGKVHDPADDAQAEFLQLLHQRADVAVAFAAGHQRNAEKERNDDDGENLALRQRLERILEQAAHELRDVVRQRHLARLEVGGGVGEHRQLQAFSRPENVGGAKADEDGDAHGGEEENQRQLPHPVHLVVGAQVGDAGDDGGKHQRHQHHAQQVEKKIADDLGAVQRIGDDRRGGLAGQPEAGREADEAADEDLQIE